MLGRNAVKHKNSGIIKGVDQVSWPQEEIHRLVLPALAHRQPCYPSRLLLVLSLGSLLQELKTWVFKEGTYLLLLAVLQTS